MKRINITLEALSPIAHGDTVTGVDNATNARLFMREARLVNGNVIRLPKLSENALRTVTVRRPAHLHLLTALGLADGGSVPQGVINLLFSGGNLSAGATQDGDAIRLGHDTHALYPTLALLSGAVDRFVLPPGKLRVTSWPITREHLPAIQHLAPELADEAATQSVFDWTENEVRTRGTSGESDGNQMLYEYETLVAGAKFLVELTLDAQARDVDAAALALALTEWDGFFGGQGRQGRGRMRITNPETLPDTAPYLEHIAAHVDVMRDGLTTGTLGTRKVLVDA